MQLIQSKLKKLYFKLFTFVADKRLKTRDVEAATIHVTIAIVLSTSLLIWSYTILSIVSIDSWVPGVVGILCSSIHLLVPLLYRITNRQNLLSDLLLFSCVFLQTTFAYYSGGFMASTLIWFGIIPMIAGLINGVRGVVLWTIVPLTISLSFLALHLYGYDFPDEISQSGRLVAQLLHVFGWIFLSFMIIYFYLYHKKHSEETHTTQSKKIDDLVRVLFHDLANPLGRISIGLNITKRSDNNDKTQRGLEIATQATDAMIEITQNVRKMYAISKGKNDIELIFYPLIDAISFVKKVCSVQLENKQVTIEYDTDSLKGLTVLVEPVSFKNQVLTNIITNSIKFSSVGQKITISAIPIDESHVRIDIKDDGVGMPQYILDNLFDINKKTSRSGTKGETGTGFGMNIMKTFLELYDGKIEVKSVEKKDNKQSGTTFSLTLRGGWNK